MKTTILSVFFLFRFPNLTELAYGSDRRGCFEVPKEDQDPASDIECPDILPIQCDDPRGNLHDPLAMKNPSQLVSTRHEPCFRVLTL